MNQTDVREIGGELVGKERCIQFSAQASDFDELFSEKTAFPESAPYMDQLLKRLDAPVVGVALNGAMEVPVPSSYYRYYTQPMGAPQGNGPRVEPRPNGQGGHPAEEKPDRVGDSPP